VLEGCRVQVVKHQLAGLLVHLQDSRQQQHQYRERQNSALYTGKRRVDLGDAVA
jgi:hypothetical protein